MDTLKILLASTYGVVKLQAEVRELLLDGSFSVVHLDGGSHQRVSLIDIPYLGNELGFYEINLVINTIVNGFKLRILFIQLNTYPVSMYINPKIPIKSGCFNGQG